jgi:acetyl-CoA acyltransferase
VIIIRTPIGRFGGALSSVRADDLGAIPLRALKERNAGVDWEAIEEVYYGCANQAGEDNRNVARMATLLAGLPVSVPGTTLNRLCGSGMDAVLAASRIIRSGEAELVLAGGVESMSRAPFVMPKADTAFSRNAEIYDTTIGWRFVNPVLKSQYGVDSMPETGENVAEDFGISREDQDAFALRSQTRAGKAQAIRSSRQGNRCGGNSAPQGGPNRCQRRRASTPGYHARTAGQAQGPVPRRRLGHSGQRVRRQ